jgi:phage-related minor tail protein
MEIPSWWLILSGAFFAINLVFFGVFIKMLLELMKVIKELKPKVDRISDRVESISNKVDGMASTMQNTLANVGQRTTNVAESVDIFSALTTSGLSRYAPAIGILGTVVKGLMMAKQLGIKMPHRRSRR